MPGVPRRPRGASTRSCTRPAAAEPDGLVRRAVERPRAGPAAALRLIRDRNFGPYFVGNAASASGTWFQNLAASLLVYRHTHSPFLLGVLSSATSCRCCCSRRGRAARPTASTGGGCCSSRSSSRRRSARVLAALAWAGLARGLGRDGVRGSGSASAARSRRRPSQALIGDLVPRDDLAVRGRAQLDDVQPRARGRAGARGALGATSSASRPSFAINAARTSCSSLGVLVVHAARRGGWRRAARRGCARACASCASSRACSRSC